MHVHLPKPLHGWRQLAGEVGIIVLGVLIALGFEQLVEAMRWRSEVGHFRTAVDHELGRNLGLYREWSGSVRVWAGVSPISSNISPIPGRAKTTADERSDGRITTAST